MFLVCGRCVHCRHLPRNDPRILQSAVIPGAGSVIHGMHEEQDLRRMGSEEIHADHLRNNVDWVAGNQWIPSSVRLFQQGRNSLVRSISESVPPARAKCFVQGAATALLTAVYMTRLMVLAFWGKERYRAAGHEEPEDHGHGHAKPMNHRPSYWVPLAVLAIPSFAGGYFGIPEALG